jgi:hypothetical protein
MVTLPSIWVIAPTPRQPDFSSPVVLADEQIPVNTPSASSSSPVMIYKPAIPEVAVTRRYIEKEPSPTVPTSSRRHSAIGAFVRRLGNVLGFKREPMHSPLRHSSVHDKSGVNKKSRLFSRLSSRTRAYSFDTATRGGFMNMKRTAGYQPDQELAGVGDGEAITDEEAHQSSSGRPSRTPRTGEGTGIDLEGLVTEFVRVEDAKRSGTGLGIGRGRQGSRTEHSPSPI